MIGNIHLDEAQAPEGLRLYAIGDIHGCADQLEKLYTRIEQDLADNPPADWRIIHLGDYCDRGPDTRRVLDLILDRSRDPRILSLMGNHEEGWLQFLSEPVSIGLFVNSGGDATCRSYGVQADFSDPAHRRTTAVALLEALPQAHLDFLRSLPRSFSFGDYFFCHAGIRPGVPLESQDPEDLIWIRRDFLLFTGLHPKVIVHGHTPREKADLLPNRINVDTGAVRGGALTAVVLEGNEKRLLQVRKDRFGLLSQLLRAGR